MIWYVMIKKIGENLNLVILLRREKKEAIEEPRSWKVISISNYIIYI